VIIGTPVRTHKYDFKLIRVRISKFDEFGCELTAGRTPVSGKIDADNLARELADIDFFPILVYEVPPNQIIQRFRRLWLGSLG